MQISSFLKFAKEIAKEAGELLVKKQARAKLKVKKKAGDFALDADYLSEKLLISRITKRYPHHDILTEETGSYENHSDYKWVLDPLEGTLNYAHKIPFWAVNVGLLYKGKPVLGVCYAPIIDEMFYAAKGKGAFLNGKKIRVSQDSQIDKSFFTGSIRDISSLDISRHLLRALGCAGLSICYVGCGRMGAAIKFRGNDPYGYVATSIIVTEAGGKITTCDGKSWSYKSQGALVSNGKLHKKLVKMMKK